MKISRDYINWLADLKNKIISARLKAVHGLSRTLMELYWDIGKEIVKKQSESSWGDRFLDRLATDLKKDFPDMKGFSRRNLYAIRQWHLFYASKYEIVPQAVAQIPWGHNRVILAKVRKVDNALAYASAAMEYGWSRDVLEMQIENRYCDRKGKSANNFSRTLPLPQSDLARQSVKDPYLFDFLELEETAQEKEIECNLMSHITSFLLELGKGFAFVGRQYRIEISGSEYFIDLLFYHLELRCYVVIELKAGRFKPEYAGKLNFYLSAVDSLLKRPDDNPSIGLILCRYKDKIEAEYSLRDIKKPMGISSYMLTQKIKGKLSSQLPTVEEMESELELKLTSKKSRKRGGKPR
jgi:predicted nuclease of restriction endonuclease-like (RecB) superfamily